MSMITQSITSQSVMLMHSVYTGYSFTVQCHTYMYMYMYIFEAHNFHELATFCGNTFCGSRVSASLHNIQEIIHELNFFSNMNKTKIMCLENLAPCSLLVRLSLTVIGS
jgi:hypothetical protein